MGSYTKRFSNKDMKVFNLTENSRVYTSNVFLAMGEWNTLDDMTTLIDVGYDEMIIDMIQNKNMGLGKKKIDQVILTHSHSDHTAILPKIIEIFNPKVYAFNPHLIGVDTVLKDGDVIKIGEMHFEVFHITSHSYDSICLFCELTGVLFAGDTNFPIDFENPILKEENAAVLARLGKHKIIKVYNGHGDLQDYTNKPFKIIKDENKLFNT